MNQVEVKRRQIQFFSYCLAGINIWVFGKSIGNNGLGYLAAAVLVFEFFWILTGKNLPDKMSKMIRGKNAKGQYRNVSKFRKNIMLFQVAVGLLATFLCITSGWLMVEKVFRVPYGSMILWILSPVLFLRCIQAVFLGYFQSEGSELPSAVSAVLRQLFYLGLGLLFLGIFRTYGEKVSLLLKKNDFTSMYGAMGIALGVLISEILLLLFTFVIYRGSKSGKKETESGMKGTDSGFHQIRSLVFGMAGDIFGQILLLLPLGFGLFLFQKNSADIYTSIENYGVFSGRYFVAMLLPAELFCGGILPGIARLYSHFRKKEERYAKTAFQTGMQGALLHGFFFVAFIAILATPLGQAVNIGAAETLANMFTLGSSLILWILLLFYFSEVLRCRGEKYLLLAGYGLTAILSAIAMLVMLNTEATVSGLVLGIVIGAAAGSVALGSFCCIKLKAKPDLLRTLAIPAGCSCACGLLAFGLEKIFLPHLGAVVTVVLELLITGLLYWFLLLALHCFREQDLVYIPGGKLLRTFGKMCRLL